MDSYSFTGNADISGIAALYEQFRENPLSVEPQWRQFFEGFDFAQHHYPKTPEKGQQFSDEFKVLNLINAYRERGHFFTKTNPVRTRRKYSPTLEIENFGLSSKDLDKEFSAAQELGLGRTTLGKIIEFLQQTYCQSIGVEFMYIRNIEVVNWIRSRMEGDRNTPHFSSSAKQQILESITRAVGFEKFIHKKFPGFKSFSLEGGESLIPALEAVIERAANLDYKDFVIGMPHRGRLNVLANILHKPYEAIFKEFDGSGFEEPSLLGDVKYHLGHSSDTLTSSGKKIHLTLSPNPSHLEAVNPVVEGIVRAMADHSYDGSFNKALPFLIHGDAALAGQGIVYEIVQMSELAAHRCGGTIHFVVNNQIGFTTNYIDGRSSVYCTDVAKIVQSPIFHVNGDDVEAVVHTALMAMDFRHTFQKDVFIDLLCYRKYGHNESDEPRYTQPKLYKIIEGHPNPLEIYLDQLLKTQVLDRETFDATINSFNARMEQGLFESKKVQRTSISNFLQKKWEHLRPATTEDFTVSPETGISSEQLKKISSIISALPEGLSFFRKIKALQDERAKMLDENRVDWAMAELLAFGSLILDGFAIRLCGQDVKRGTFSQRHSVFTAEDAEEEYIPLQHLVEGENSFHVYNSLLSEYGVLGFEYGYAWASPNSLTIWEAQFGDFVNGGQIIIDQFITAAEEKWNVSNGLVMLLPHGYEGQGPEHSSGRMERFLTACAHNNIQVANCSTPANYFHLLRRQLHRPFRKPLVVFTPKSLLRNVNCISSAESFSTGGFKEVFGDNSVNPLNVKRVLFCTGKIFYDLSTARTAKNCEDTAIIRIEQIYPFPEQQLAQIVRTFAAATEWIWIQEEPANMGAARFVREKFTEVPLQVIARPESGSPATGSSVLHKEYQQKLMDQAFQKTS